MCPTLGKRESDPLHVDDQLAEEAGVSKGTLHKVATIEERGTADQKARLLAELAKERQAATQIRDGKPPVCPTLGGPETDPGRVDDQLAAEAGVSKGTLHKVATIEERGTADQKARLLAELAKERMLAGVANPVPTSGQGGEPGRVDAQLAAEAGVGPHGTGARSPRQPLMMTR